MNRHATLSRSFDLRILSEDCCQLILIIICRLITGQFYGKSNLWSVNWHTGQF